MIPYLPRYISDRAAVVYVASLAVISLAFWDYAISPVFALIGAVFVLSFFYGSGFFGRKWLDVRQPYFVTQLFWTAFLMRIIWVVFSYVFYSGQTGMPFEWDTADAYGYHSDAAWLAGSDWNTALQYLFHGDKSLSDAGYPLYLSCLYRLIGPNVICTRFLKALLSAWTCVLVYKLSSRTFGESTGRVAAVFCMLMPNLIYYCGLHLKETEMTFLCVAFLERADNLLKRKRYGFLEVAVPICLAISLFFFRTVLGVVALFSLATVILFSSFKLVGRRKKMVLAIWVGLAFVSLAGGAIMNEVEEYWHLRVTNQDVKRTRQVASGMQWAKYATGTVMAPLIFSIPLATMVDTDQKNQLVISGGNFVKTFMSIFVFIAIFSALKSGKWRDFMLIGTFCIGYLMIIAFSGYANAERFHVPALPCVLMMAAYGVSQFSLKTVRYFTYWSLAVFCMTFAWAFFKLGGRGLI